MPLMLAKRVDSSQKNEQVKLAKLKIKVSELDKIYILLGFKTMHFAARNGGFISTF